MKKNIHNRKYLMERRKALRNNSTSAEAALWKHLRRSQLDGRKFRRQHSIENYIVDFYCASEQLIVELDGSVHFNFVQQNKDRERTKRLETLGFRVVRFENKEVFENLTSVLGEIVLNFRK
ncbi:endonuclease domain-containing protein [Flavobacteriaceae bacterium LMO-SS05]